MFKWLNSGNKLKSRKTDKNKDNINEVKVTATDNIDIKPLNDQTIRQYASISKIPLKQVLEDLKNSGYSCNAADVVTPNIRQILAKAFRMRVKALKEAESARLEAINEAESARLEAINEAESARLEAIKEAEAARLEAIKEALVLEQAKTKADKALCELKKIGKIIDICFELIPESIGITIREGINNQVMSEVYIKSYYDNLKACFFIEKLLKDNTVMNNCDDINDFLSRVFPTDVNNYRNLTAVYYYDTQLFCNKINISHRVVHKYKLDEIIKNYELDKRKSKSTIDDFVKQINKRKKDNLYTVALIEIIYFLINCSFIYNGKPRWSYNKFSFIGELFIEMGVVNSALNLYKVDESIFSNSNSLSILASSFVRVGNSETAIELVSKLIEQEPYHPSIPIIQTEIKRLEKRSYLKSAFSIDLSKVNELSGIEFENLLIDKFSSLGFKAESTPKIGDFGADLIVENSESSRIIIQCKRFKSKVNLKAVQEVVGAMGHYSGDIGIVITNNSFLNSAVKLAESHDIELWNGDNLVSFLAGDLSFSSSIGEP